MNFKKSIFSVLFSFTITLQLHASHIVGGEITLKHLSGNSYRITLNLYFDLINGNPAAQDPYVQVTFYDKSTNKLLDTIYLPRTFYTDIPTEKGVCSYIKLQTRKLIYTKDTILDPSKYNGSAGFYAAWSRCCRNAAAENIINPANAATVFYSEFPPLNTIDSSPEFATPAKNVFACTGVPFTYDFSATDPDGDTLRYQLVTPLNGNLTSDAPGGWAPPSPYKPVVFKNGFSVANMIPSSVPLTINSITGIMSFTGIMPGIYVFSAQCSEYRNGVYLGSVRRDYQLSVLNCGRPNDKPILEAINPNTNALYNPLDTIKIDNRLLNCISLMAFDTIQGQKLTVTAKSLNFTSPLTVSPAFYITQSIADTVSFKVCLDHCIRSQANTFKVQLIVANENNCTLPKYDTVITTLKNISTINQPTVINTTLSDTLAEILVDKKLNFTISAENPDGNPIKLYAKGIGFLLPEQNMNFSSIVGIGSIKSDFSLISLCSHLKRSPFLVRFISRDSSCFAVRYDSVNLHINIKDTVINYQQPFVNVITPNGDGVNDVFELHNLPKDNCTEMFSSVEIYNRWGTKVFSDKNRGFKWDASDITDGVYYYLLKYNKLVLKGWLQIIR